MCKQLRLLSSFSLQCKDHRMCLSIPECCNLVIQSKPANKRNNSLSAFEKPVLQLIVINTYLSLTVLMCFELKKMKHCRICTFCTIDSALVFLHLSCSKLPYVPPGVLKLANLIEEMT
ncbi:hypothetical protein Droror1_Dr00003569 [Drosera rotundifolia]